MTKTEQKRVLVWRLKLIVNQLSKIRGVPSTRSNVALEQVNYPAALPLRHTGFPRRTRESAIDTPFIYIYVELKEWMWVCRKALEGCAVPPVLDMEQTCQR